MVSQLGFEPFAILSYSTVEINDASRSGNRHGLIGSFSTDASCIVPGRYGFTWTRDGLNCESLVYICERIISVKDEYCSEHMLIEPRTRQRLGALARSMWAGHVAQRNRQRWFSWAALAICSCSHLPTQCQLRTPMLMLNETETETRTEIMMAQKNRTALTVRYKSKSLPPPPKVRFCITPVLHPLRVLLAKDLSHVPCKFFKVGACTAGSSCPFSHVVPEPGQKEACAWFVKGNCKFGHKCALAHILPGQSMAMDRKNKKAAQAAAAATTAAEKGTLGPKDGSKDVAARGGATRKRDGHLTSAVTGHTGAHGNGTAAHGGSGRNALLTGGSTAPTRILSSSSTSTPSTRPPINMPLKAPISPSAPAPSLKDTDFASFALDEMEGVDSPAPQGQGKTDHETKEEQEHGKPPSDAATSDLARVADVGHPRRESQPPSPVHLPTSAPRPSAPLATSNFGPIGSPPSATRSNGLLASRKVAGTISPGTSPRSNSGANFLHPSMNHGTHSSNRIDYN